MTCTRGAMSVPSTMPAQATRPLVARPSTAITTTENGTMRLNTNPMNRLDNENINDTQENFYHTLISIKNGKRFNILKNFYDYKKRTLVFPELGIKASVSKYSLN